MSPQPYLDKEILNKIREEVDLQGLKPDEILLNKADQPTYGLNLAIEWPFPDFLKEKYETLVKQLRKFDSNVYVYPFDNTHITLMTLVNFKNHFNPSKEEVVQINQLIPRIISACSCILGLRKFSIDIGAPVLSSKAGFFPINNPGGEILKIRKAVLSSLTEILSEMSVPGIIHSTFLRFLKDFENTSLFVKEFDKIVTNFNLGKIVIDKILLTAETKPYMRSGKILHTFKLKD